MITLSRLFSVVLLVSVSSMLVVRDVFAQSAADSLALKHLRLDSSEDYYTHLTRFLEAHPDSVWASNVLTRLASVATDVPHFVGDIEAVRAALSNPRTPPMFRLDLRRHLFARLTETLEVEKALNVRETLGEIRHWLGVGPFGRSATAFHQSVSAPELDVEGSPFAGTLGPVDWQVLPMSQFQSLVEPAKFLPRLNLGGVYVLSQVKAPVEGEYLLRIHAPGSFKVFVNGRLILDIDRHREFCSAEVGVKVHLETDWNHLLVKLSPPEEGGASELSAALLAANGDYFTGFTFEPGKVIHHRGTSQAASAGQRIELPLDRVLSMAVDAADDHANFIQALYLEGANRQPEAYERLSHLVNSSDLILAWMATSIIEERNQMIPQAERTEAARVSYERLIAADAGLLLPVISRARQEIAADKAELAIKRLRAWEEKNGPNVSVFSVLLDAYTARRWRAEYDLTLSRWLAFAPKNYRALTLKRQRLIETRNVDQALAVNEEMLGLNRSQFQDRLMTFLLNLDYGTLEAAEAALRVLEQAPVDERLVNASKIRLLTRKLVLGDQSAADELQQAADQRVLIEGPSVPDLIRTADLLVDAGRPETAARYYEMARHLAPEVKRLRVFAGLDADHDRLFERFRPDVPTLRREVEEGLKGEYKGASSVYVLDHMVTVVESDGFMATEVHEVIRLNDKNAIERHGTVSGGEELLKVAVHQPDGQIFEPIGRGTLTLPGLKPGSTVELRHRRKGSLNDDPDQVVGAFYFQDRDLEAAAPFHLSRWVVVFPKGSAFEIDKRNFDGKHEIIEEESRTIHVFEKNRVPRLLPEPGMPDPVELVPAIHISRSRPAWSQLNLELLNRYTDLFRVTPLVRAVTQPLTEGLSDDGEKVRRIYEWVMREIRTEDGGGYPDQTLAEKNGPRLPLLAAMLRAADVPFRQASAMVREDPTAPIIWKEVTVDDFNYDLLEVNPKAHSPIWMQTHYSKMKLGSLPESIAGALVFLPDEAGGETRHLPPSSDVAENTLIDVEVGRERSLAQVTSILGSETGAQVLDLIEGWSNDQRKAVAQNFAAQMFPGMNPRMKSFEWDLSAAAQGEIHLKFSTDLSGVLVQRGEDMSLRPLAPPLNLVRMFVSGKSDRRFPLLFPKMPASRYQIRVRLPAGVEVQRTPDDLGVMAPYGRVSLNVRPTAEGVVINRAIRWELQRIQPQDYANFVKFCHLVDDVHGERIQLRGTERLRDR